MPPKFLPLIAAALAFAVAGPCSAADPDAALKVPFPTPVAMTEGLADLGNVKL